MLISAFSLAEVPYNTERWVQLLAVGVLDAPPTPITIPPLIEKLFWSQSIPSSGVVVPEHIVRPPVNESVPFESIASLLEL